MAGDVSHSSDQQTSSTASVAQTVEETKTDESLELAEEPSTSGLLVQPKLVVGAPDDPSEQEADAMADQVMKMSPPTIQRQCSACEEEEKISPKRVTPIQRFSMSGESGSEVSSDISKSINGSKGQGQALPNSTKSMMEDRFQADFSRVNVHTDANSTNLNRQLNARAFTVGNDIFFNQGEFNPQSNSGQHLLAHELTHTLQQGGSERKIQREEGEGEIGTSVPPNSPSRITNPNEPLPVQFAVSVQGIHFRPIEDGVVYGTELVIRTYLMRAALYRLLQENYQESALTAVLNRYSSDEDYSGSWSSATGMSTVGDEVRDFRLGETKSMDLIRFLEEDLGLKTVLSDSQRELLAIGIATDALYIALGELNQKLIDFPNLRSINLLGVELLPMPPWFNYDFFKARIRKKPAKVQAYKNTENKANILNEIYYMLYRDAALLDIFRKDRRLVTNPETQTLYNILWAMGEGNRNVASASQHPNASLADIFLDYLGTQPELTEKARKSAQARVTLFQRFVRYADRIEELRNTDRFGDQQISDFDQHYNAAAHPATLNVNPATQPLNYIPGTEYYYTMSMKFPDMYAAIAEKFGGYHYIWEKVKLDMQGNEEEVTDPGTAELMGARLSRAHRYNITDVNRLVNDLGPIGVGVAYSIQGLFILRYAGAVLETILEPLLTPSSTRAMVFDEPGAYLVRCIATPRPADEEGEIVREPSVAYLPVFVQDSHEDVVENQLDGMLAAEQHKAEQIRALRLKLQAPFGLTDEARAEIEAKIQELENPPPALEDEFTQTLEKLKAEKARLDKEIAQTTEDINRAAVLPHLRDRQRWLEHEIKRLEGILSNREDRMDSQDLEGTESFRLQAIFNSDEGKTIPLTIEIFVVEEEAPFRVYVNDLTSDKAGADYGTGDTIPEAIKAGFKEYMENGVHGYGRGYVGFVHEGERYTQRIDKSKSALLLDYIETATQAITVAAVVAAPFTGGATLAVLVPVGIIGGVPSAYRLVKGNEAATLGFDLQTALDVVGVVGAVLGAAQAGTAARATSLLNADRIVSAMPYQRIGNALMMVSNASDIAQVTIVLPVSVMAQLDAVKDLPPGKREVQILKILGNAMLEIGLTVGQHLLDKSLSLQREIGDSNVAIANMPERLFNRFEVEGSIGRSEVQVVPESMLAETQWVPQGDSQVHEGIQNPDLAYQLYDSQVRANEGQKEVAIFYNPEESTYAVVIGTETQVSAPREGRWEGVVHFHPNPTNATRFRQPAPADFRAAIRKAEETGLPVREFLEYDIPGHGRGRTEYGVNPGAEQPFYIKVFLPDGDVSTLTFKDSGEYTAYWGQDTIYVKPDSPLYHALVAEIENLAAGIRNTDDHRTMAGLDDPPGGAVQDGSEGVTQDVPNLAEQAPKEAVVEDAPAPMTELDRTNQQIVDAQSDLAELRGKERAFDSLFLKYFEAMSVLRSTSQDYDTRRQRAVDLLVEMMNDIANAASRETLSADTPLTDDLNSVGRHDFGDEKIEFLDEFVSLLADDYNAIYDKAETFSDPQEKLDYLRNQAVDLINNAERLGPVFNAITRTKKSVLDPIKGDITRQTNSISQLEILSRELGQWPTPELGELAAAIAVDRASSNKVKSRDADNKILGGTVAAGKPDIQGVDASVVTARSSKAYPEGAIKKHNLRYHPETRGLAPEGTATVGAEQLRVVDGLGRGPTYIMRDGQPAYVLLDAPDGHFFIGYNASIADNYPTLSLRNSQTSNYQLVPGHDQADLTITIDRQVVWRQEGDSRSVNHAEQTVLGNIADRIDAGLSQQHTDPVALAQARRDVRGTIVMLVDQAVCGHCQAGFKDNPEIRGPLIQFTEQFPNVRVEIWARDPTLNEGVPSSYLLIHQGRKTVESID